MKYYLVILIQVLSLQAAFASIGSAIQLKIQNAKSGDTLFLEEGTFDETGLIIDKPLVMIGVGDVVINGMNKDNVLTITSDKVILQGIKIINSGYSSYNDLAGIMIKNCSEVQILNCEVRDCFFGIYFSNSKNCRVENSTVISSRSTETKSGNGIHLWKSDNFIIKGNHVSGNRDGIYLEFATNIQVLNNESLQNIRYGLHFMFSHNNTYDNNIFRSNGAGVAVMYTKNVKMTNNRFVDNQGISSYGLLLKDITDSYIVGNTFSNNTVAITMEESNRIQVNNNNFTGNGWAMKIQASCSDNVITRNNYVANTFDITTNGTAVMNTFNENYWDKYSGYDLDKDQKGDVPYYPVSVYSVIVERIPVAMILYRSFIVTLLEQMEKIMPSITPVDLVDTKPLLRPYTHD